MGDIPVLGTWRMTAFFSMKVTFVDHRILLCFSELHVFTIDGLDARIGSY